MFKYLLKRILLALPTLLVISFLAFGLGKCAPGDPVVNVFGEESYNSLDPVVQGKTYEGNAARLGLKGPEFYFSLTTAAYPDTLWRIFPLDRRIRLENLIGQSGNWEAVQQYDRAISHTARAIEALPASLPQSAGIRTAFTFMIQEDELDLLDSSLFSIQRLCAEIPGFITPDKAGSQEAGASSFPALSTAFFELHAATSALKIQKTPGRLKLPRLYWHGLNNQYHHWLTGFLSGDLGMTRRKLPVWEEIHSSLLATMMINGIAILLAYLMAIPMGVELARRKGKWPDRWGKRGLFFLYSMPVFWLAGMLIMFFSNSSLGHTLLPSIYFDVQDAWQPGKTSFGQWWSANASKCVLPIVILSLHSLAVLALQLRGGMLSALAHDYIRTARAKGVSEEDVYWSHALRNALFPLITIFASVLPAVFTGSLVIEALFNFPGIGTKTFEAYLGKDLPLLAAIMMVAATLTILGSLLADLLYAWADPRVRFAKENG